MANDGPIRLVTYPGSVVTPLDDAVVYDAAIGGSGVMHGCEVEMVGSLQIHINPGHGVIRGRKFTVSDTTIDIPAAVTGTQTGNILIVLDLAGGDVPPISFEAHTPAEAADEDTPAHRKTNDPNYDTTVKWKLELCTYKVNTSGLTAQPTLTAVNLARVTRIKNVKTGKFNSGEITMDKNWIGLDKVENIEPAKLDVRSATKLYTARKIALTGTITGEASFNGTKDIEIKTKINYEPGYLQKTFTLSPYPNNKDLKDTYIKFVAYRMGAIVVGRIYSTAFTGEQWQEMAARWAAQGATFINDANKTEKKFVPKASWRELSPLQNAAINSTTYWIRFSITTIGNLEIITNVPKDKVARAATCQLIYPAKDLKWNW